MRRGGVESGVRADLRELGEIPRTRVTLARTALVLAQTLDEGAGLSTAAVARELRATMAALTDDSHGDDDGSAALDAWVAGLSAEVGDTA